MTSDETGAAEAAVETTDSRMSMEEQMGAVFDQMEKAEAEAVEAEKAAVAEPEDSQEETQQQKRGPDGKFAAKDAEPEEEGEAAEAVEGEQTVSAEESQQEPAKEPASLEAPTSWSTAAKSEWAKLPPAIQQEVLKRESDVAKGFEERANRLKSYEPIEQALEPVRRMLDLNGVSPGQYVRQLVAAEQYLQTNPAEAIQYLARSYGVDLQGMTQQQAEAAPADPAVAALTQQVQQLTQHITSSAQQQQAQQHDAVARQIEDFKADPKHKHFDAVYDDMVAMAAAERSMGKQPSLGTLYERAVWANPSVREQILAEQKAEQERKTAEERARKVKEARRAAGTNMGSQGTGGQTPSYGSLEEELAAAYDRVQGAA